MKQKLSFEVETFFCRNASKRWLHCVSSKACFDFRICVLFPDCSFVSWKGIPVSWEVL